MESRPFGLVIADDRSLAADQPDPGYPVWTGASDAEAIPTCTGAQVCWHPPVGPKICHNYTRIIDLATYCL
jgi:hypothetical protein